MTSTPEGDANWTQPSPTQGTDGYGTGSGWGSAHEAPGYAAPGQGPTTAHPAPGGGTSAPPAPTGYGPQIGYGTAPAGYAALREAARPGIVPLRPLTVGEVLDGAFRSVRANPGVMFGLASAVVTVTVIVQSVLQWYVQGLIAASLARTFDGTEGLEGLDQFLAGSIAASTAQLLTTTPTFGIAISILTGLLMVSVSRSVIGQRVSAAETWAKVRPHAVALVVFSILLNLALSLVMALVVAVVVAFAAAEQFGLALLGTVVGLLGFIVLSVWLVVRTLLVPAVLVLEDQPLWRGIARAWRLTRGSFWRLFGVLLLAGVIVGVVTSVVAVPGSFVLAFAFPMADPTSLGPLLVNAVIMVIAQTISTVFLAAVIALQYIDVRMRREGLDVALARAAAEAQ